MLSYISQLLSASARMKIKEMFSASSFGTLSYSQEGEDLILKRIFDCRAKGFYVDVGAHHPFRFSNSYLFYKKGWNGIVVDPLPGTKRLFKRYRHRDIVIENGISSINEIKRYYMFEESALNTFDVSVFEARKKAMVSNVLGSIDIECFTLSALFQKILPKHINGIEFLSVDVEGYDFDVLQSNDWRTYRPEAVVVECLDSSISNLCENQIVIFMQKQGYVPFSKAFHSVIFKRT